MSSFTGQQFVVENRAGAGGVIANDAVAKSPPDGYTVGMGGIANNVIAIGTYAKLPYEPAADFTFISGLWHVPNILVAAKDFPASNARDLIALLKQNPGKYNYASAGIGTTLHLSGEMMKSMAGVDVQHIPYKGTNPALMDLLAGRVNMLFDNLPGSLPAVREGSVKPIAVTGKTRSPALPDVPAMAELLPGYELTSWAALCGPAGMAPDVTAGINERAVKSLNDPDLLRRFEELGATAWPTSPQEVTAFRATEETRLLPVIRAAGITPQ
jgi:tripartite-type tricarboxylate transporter receptor subunit TctC